MTKRFALLLYMVLCTYAYTKAEKLWSHIITNDQDTIDGYIKNYWFNKATGNVVFNGIDLSNYHNEVTFKQPGGNYNHYKPEDIKGFSFTYDGQIYTFTSFLVQKNSIIKKEDNVSKFLLLLFDGKISLYSEMTWKYFSDNRKDTYEMSLPASYNSRHYYLFSEALGISSIDSPNDVDATFEMLKKYGVENDFIEKYCAENKVYDIMDLFQAYIHWKSIQEEHLNKNT